MSEPRWDDLRVFLAAHRAGSFSAAARVLGTEQSTVSRRISALEQALGGSLFLRSRSGLVLTEQGEAVLPLALEAQLRIRELAEVAAPHARGQVRLAITDGMAVHGLIPRLSELYTHHPELELALITGVETSDLTRREADLALRFVAPHSGDLVVRRVAELMLGVWVHRDLQHQTPLPWVGLDLGPIQTPEMKIMAQQRARPRMTCGSYLSVLAALRHRLGASVITDSLARQFPELVRLPIPVDQRLSLYLVGHAASRHTPRVAAVWRFLEGWAREVNQAS